MRNGNEYCPSERLLEYLKSKNIVLRSSGSSSDSKSLKKIYIYTENDKNCITEFILEEDGEKQGYPQRWVEHVFSKIGKYYRSISLNIDDLDFLIYPNDFPM